MMIIPAPYICFSASLIADKNEVYNKVLRFLKRGNDFSECIRLSEWLTTNYPTVNAFRRVYIASLAGKCASLQLAERQTNLLPHDLEIYERQFSEWERNPSLQKPSRPYVYTWDNNALYISSDKTKAQIESLKQRCFSQANQLLEDASENKEKSEAYLLRAWVRYLLDFSANPGSADPKLPGYDLKTKNDIIISDIDACINFDSENKQTIESCADLLKLYSSVSMYPSPEITQKIIEMYGTCFRYTEDRDKSNLEKILTVRSIRNSKGIKFPENVKQLLYEKPVESENAWLYIETAIINYDENSEENKKSIEMLKTATRKLKLSFPKIYFNAPIEIDSIKKYSLYRNSHSSLALGSQCSHINNIISNCKWLSGEEKESLIFGLVYLYLKFGDVQINDLIFFNILLFSLEINENKSVNVQEKLTEINIKIEEARKTRQKNTASQYLISRPW